MSQKKQRRRFDREFKNQAVKLVLQGNRTASSVARDLDIHVNVLQRWKREYQENQTTSFPGKGNISSEESQI